MELPIVLYNDHAYVNQRLNNLNVTDNDRKCQSQLDSCVFQCDSDSVEPLTKYYVFLSRFIMSYTTIELILEILNFENPANKLSETEVGFSHYEAHGRPYRLWHCGVQLGRRREYREEPWVVFCGDHRVKHELGIADTSALTFWYRFRWL